MMLAGVLFGTHPGIPGIPGSGVTKCGSDVSFHVRPLVRMAESKQTPSNHYFSVCFSVQAPSIVLLWKLVLDQPYLTFVKSNAPERPWSSHCLLGVVGSLQKSCGKPHSVRAPFLPRSHLQPMQHGRIKATHTPIKHMRCEKWPFKFRVKTKSSISKGVAGI